MKIIPLPPEHREWALHTLEEYWGSLQMMSRWRYHDLSELPVFVALLKNEPVGIATYYIFQEACELVSLNSFVEGKGIGEALLYAVRDAAVAAGCKRLWLTTSNDNMPALQFYQKRGMAIVAIHRYAIDEARKENPHIPIRGFNGIPCRDELELEMIL
jgi:DNA-3-methyladenine glycosylase I